MADAATIINDAARRTPGLEVKGADPHRHRDPYRTIRLVEIEIPRCPEHPKGHRIYVHPRQVQQHLAIYPGSYVRRELQSRTRGRRRHGSGMHAEGHRGVKDILKPGQTVADAFGVR